MFELLKEKYITNNKYNAKLKVGDINAIKQILLDQNKELVNKINKLQELIDNSKYQMKERDNKIKNYLLTYDKIWGKGDKNSKEKNKKRMRFKYNPIQEKIKLKQA